METQRNLYEFALFNEVNTAVQNPFGGETTKTVLLQAVEARRWTLTYGAGFEAQTGTPQNNCAGLIANGAPCTPNGRTGISPRALLSVTRNNLFGREQSASMQGTYGLLEQRVNFIYQNPHFLGHRNLGLTFNGGYAQQPGRDNLRGFAARRRIPVHARALRRSVRLSRAPTRLSTNSISAA